MNNPDEIGGYNTPLLCGGIWVSRVLGTLGFIPVIPEDFFIGHDASQVLEKDSIIVLEGEYPVSYAYGAYGTILVKYISLSN